MMDKHDKLTQHAASKLREFYQSSDSYRDMLQARPEVDFANYIDFVETYIPAGSKVLEIGSGAGQAAGILQTRGIEVIATEVSPLFLAATQIGSLSAVVADAGRLPFAEGSFDAVISNEVVEHIVEVGQVLDEMVRIVRRGGLVLVRGPQLSSPIWPVLDLPNLLTGRGRPPHYSNLRAGFRFFIENSIRSLRIAASKEVEFHWREPDLSGSGGDADATYWSSSVELTRFLKARGCRILSRADTGPTFSRSWFVGRFSPWLHPTIAIAAQKLHSNGHTDPPEMTC